MTNVLWFSRHEMTPEQAAALGEAEITQINRTITRAAELKEEIEQADIIAIVAPINLQQEFLRLAGSRPVIMAVSDRVLVPGEAGQEAKVNFVFREWIRLIKIDIVTEHFAG